MSFWKKRDEGFEWHQYVRTTIKLRRDARRDKAQKLGQKAAEGAKAASAAASIAAQGGMQRLAGFSRTAASGSGRLAASGLRLAGAALGTFAVAAGRHLEPLAHALGRPGFSGPLIFAGTIATAAGFGRVFFAGSGLDAEALTALITGLICLSLGLGPAVWLGHSVLPARLAAPFAALGARGRIAAGTVASLALAGAFVLASGAAGLRLPLFAGLPSLPFSSGSQKVEGRASVVAADLLRLGDTTVRLEGIEPPDRYQRCLRSGTAASAKTWSCGEDAREALSRIIRGHALVCMVAEKDANGVSSGRCQAGKTDVGEALVKAGYAFSDGGLMSSYRTAENEAKAAKTGMWIAAEPERPAEWRARLWAEAKLQAPEGCPIKGRVARGERIYLLPWANDYAKARINKQRGERWFCSEDDAVAAGWRIGGRG